MESSTICKYFVINEPGWRGGSRADLGSVRNPGVQVPHGTLKKRPTLNVQLQRRIQTVAVERWTLDVQRWALKSLVTAQATSVRVNAS